MHRTADSADAKGSMHAVLREYERLTGEQRAIEQEIAAIVHELTSGAGAPGLAGPLVDADGFPRSDIDVYRVRHQRHAFAVKQNDHKAVMQRIEQILPQVFEAKTKAAAADTDHNPPSDTASAPARLAAASAPASADVFALKEIDAADKARKPFAVVESVQSDSPAKWADLCAGDQVLVFGTADATNHRELGAIKEIVQHNVGSPIRVVVRRSSTASEQWTFHELLLTPQQWRGPGVLGCLLTPVLESNDQRSP